MSYNAPYSANVHGMSHAVMAEGIYKTHAHLVMALGEVNALDVLHALVTRLVDEKLVENQYDGAADFLSALDEMFAKDTGASFVLNVIRDTLIAY